MEKIQTAVSLALRDTEICTAAADVREIPNPESPEDADNRRVLAVITHKDHKVMNIGDGEDEDVGQEEGCVFVMKYKFPSSIELYPYLLFPIDSNFSAYLKQQYGSDSSEFKVVLMAPNKSIMLGSRHMHTLSSVLEEARRLRKIKDPNSTILSPKLPFSDKTGDSAGSEPRSKIKDNWGPDPQLDRPDRKTEEDSVPNNEEPSGSDPDPRNEDLNNFERSYPSRSNSNTSMNDGEERYWEWLHFYLSHRSSRILPSQRRKPRDIRLVKSGYKPSEASAAFLDDEDNDIAFIRDQWFHRQLSLRRDEYSKPRILKLRIGTFNVNGKLPTQHLAPWIWPAKKRSKSHNGESRSQETDDLSDLLAEETSDHGPNTSTIEVPVSALAKSHTATTFGVQGSKNTHAHSSPVFPNKDENIPDIFILGFQELDLSAEALLYSTSTLKADAWISAIFVALGKEADNYIKLTSKQLVGVLVVVIIRKEIKYLVKDVTTSAAGVGLMGIMGNKGATAVRLRLNSTTATFVCSHLAAFDEYVERRNSDFAEIARKLDFPIPWKGIRAGNAQGGRDLTANIWETDMLFWLGDLNYRIDLPDEEIRMLLRSEPRGSENSTLLVYDQLRTSARHKRAFVGFKEHDIEFPPTYRFHEELRDPLGYDRKRKPAWTDRILHLSADPTMVSQTSYQSCPMVTFSDHHPVSADFDIDVRDHDSHKLHAVAGALFKKLGDFEDSTLIPTVTILDGLETQLGSVSYMKPVSRSIRVRNDGKLACAFRFIPLESGSPICKEWLEVEPIDGILLPGETESIQITVNIDRRTASFMNHANTPLEDNIIFRVTKGADYIISVFGSYQPTCFANSLAWLVRSAGPIRTHGSMASLPEVNTLSAPRELMFLVEWLITNAQDVPDLFMAPADESLVHDIREYLDTQRLDSDMGRNIVFPDDKDHSAVALAYGETLLQFLDSLTEPVIPWVLHPRCAAARDREDVFEILDDVPGFARNVYVTITAFLHFIAQSGSLERSVALARVFADVLLRDNPKAPPGVPDLTPLRKRNFLLCTIS